MDKWKKVPFFQMVKKLQMLHQKANVIRCILLQPLCWRCAECTFHHDVESVEFVLAAQHETFCNFETTAKEDFDY